MEKQVNVVCLRPGRRRTVTLALRLALYMYTELLEWQVELSQGPCNSRVELSIENLGMEQ